METGLWVLTPRCALPRPRAPPQDLQTCPSASQSQGSRTPLLAARLTRSCTPLHGPGGRQGRHLPAGMGWVPRGEGSPPCRLTSQDSCSQNRGQTYPDVALWGLVVNGHTQQATAGRAAATDHPPSAPAAPSLPPSHIPFHPFPPLLPSHLLLCHHLDCDRHLSLPNQTYAGAQGKDKN